ncbi:Glutathione peroxidase [Hondaea fermentalgiana]|uniref:Glutathione peroxidase n=1 Tax=Hondaea fermentalgiana TaxID=2315210 RepID=A0A2R5GZH9_9STRA|nr:Glutathione peroxidase [Hondaea fermentalgiana]|eukprot:GBG33444.1 Glutathione peroxidase [Hondaea fermentalgiana]
MLKALRGLWTPQSQLSSVYEASLKTLDGGETVDFANLKGKVLLLVNVAGKCGLTKGEYTGLQKLHDKYAQEGLVVVGFPCNQYV